ncbi:MAG: transcriptional regulator NrdR [Ardenticatenaceae bacterium]
MKCPFCQLEHTRVIDTRTIGQSIRRRRECQQCKQRFTTHERIARTNLMVIKSDGRREEFDQDKLFTGIKLACSKRPISIDTLDKLVNDIESDLYDMGQREVKSETIGEKVMERLIGLDEVAYIRFASVHCDFADLDSLSTEIARLQEQKAREQRSDRQNG